MILQTNQRRKKDFCQLFNKTRTQTKDITRKSIGNIEKKDRVSLKKFERGEKEKRRDR